MDEINPDFASTDVTWSSVPTMSSIPRRRTILQPDLRHADPRGRPLTQVYFLKRSMNPGYSGVDNLLFYRTTPR
jgi:NAD(P) transhydrogenase subunit beta